MRSMGLAYPDPSGSGEFPELPGGETICRATVPGGGPRLWQGLDQQRRARGIQVLFDTPAERLVQDPQTKEIIGVVARQGDNKVFVKARKAVALCTGGFEYDEEMKMNHLRAYPSWFYTNPNNTGEGIRMGQAVGGDLWHMNSLSARAIPYHPDWGKGFGVVTRQPFIIVNKLGKRFFYETQWPSHSAWLEFVNFSTRDGAYLTTPAYIIYDETTRKPLIGTNSKGYLGDSTTLQYWPPTWSADHSVEVAKGWIFRGATPEELGEQLKAEPENQGFMDPATLKETFTKYNQYVAAGIDPEFNRPPSTLVKLETPPFYAVKIYPGGPNTQGGLKKDAKSRVLDPFGQPIPRLYCVGENGSVYGFLYPTGGGNVAEFVIFGQVAGKNMAKETSLA
jgi:succinate dehydrogenase/fumarate reductase flavoprotein subunit